MFGSKAALTLALICSAWSAAQAGDYLHPSGPGGWSQRVQIVYHADTRSVARKPVRVWNPSPEKDLDFVWEPAPRQPDDGIAPDGTVSGKGRLIWRIKGSASYDPKTIFSSYAGDFRDGRPHGKGRLEIRSGEVLDGDWKHGQAEGQVVWIDEAGNRYEGEFSAGKPQGKGRYRSTNGAIFTGNFVAGLREGEGETRMPGGTVYRSRWQHGVEIGTDRPEIMADATIGGLLRAQSGGGDAGKVEIAVSVDERMNQQSEMKYQHLVRDEDIAIYPFAEDVNNAWNGTGAIQTSSYTFDGTDWDESPAFVEVALNTANGARAKIAKLQLDVASSETYRKPMLTLQEHFGCVGFRPDFSLVNHGWGEVRDAKLTLQFAGEVEEEGEAMSRVFEKKIDNFDPGADVSIRDLLNQAGVDTAKLEAKRFTCQSRDSLNVCKSQVFNDVGFGEISDYIWGEDKLSTTIAGKLDYSWVDDHGNVYTQSEPFRAAIALAMIEIPEELAECGDGFGGSPEALRYQDVLLPFDGQNYVVDLPVRGNKNISAYKARLKLHSERSTFHQMKVSAHFADGSTRESKPLSLFYFHPRAVTFESSSQPASCYIVEKPGGC